jgi:hypothetical protein
VEPGADFRRTLGIVRAKEYASRRADMLTDTHTDDLAAVVRHALETTRATTVCPFHRDVIVRIGDDAAESHAFERVKRMARSDGTKWEKESLRMEIGRQLGAAADGCCPKCDPTAPGR